MDREEYMFVVILLAVAFAFGLIVGLPVLPNDSIVNHCNELGYSTALKQSGTYYCADKLIIEDSYRIEE